MDLAEAAYRLTASFPKQEMYGFDLAQFDELRRSVPAEYRRRLWS